MLIFLAKVEVIVGDVLVEVIVGVFAIVDVVLIVGVTYGKVFELRIEVI